MSRKRYAALAGAGAVVLALGGCSGGTTGPAGSGGSGGPTTSATASVAAVPGDEGGHATPRSESSPEAAEAFLACLTDAGVGAAIVDETRVVLVADVDGGSASSAEDVSQAEERCRAEVPEYHEPDFDER